MKGMSLSVRKLSKRRGETLGPTGRHLKERTGLGKRGV